MRIALAFILLLAGGAQAADISDPTRFMFVADRVENLIDVISLDDAVSSGVFGRPQHRRTSSHFHLQHPAMIFGWR